MDKKQDLTNCLQLAWNGLREGAIPIAADSGTYLQAANLAGWAVAYEAEALGFGDNGASNNSFCGKLLERFFGTHPYSGTTAEFYCGLRYDMSQIDMEKLCSATTTMEERDAIMRTLPGYIEK